MNTRISDVLQILAFTAVILGVIFFQDDVRAKFMSKSSDNEMVHVESQVETLEAPQAPTSTVQNIEQGTQIEAKTNTIVENNSVVTEPKPKETVSPKTADSGKVSISASYSNESDTLILSGTNLLDEFGKVSLSLFIDPSSLDPTLIPQMKYARVQDFSLTQKNTLASLSDTKIEIKSYASVPFCDDILRVFPEFENSGKKVKVGIGISTGVTPSSVAPDVTFEIECRDTTRKLEDVSRYDDPSPIIPGVTAYNQLVGRSTVGELFEANIIIASNDERNPIVGLEITNPTPKGASPSIILGDLEHVVKWTPNEADFSTRALKITAKLQDGSVALVDTPVTVTKYRLVEAIPLKGPGNYSDVNGRYLVNVVGPTPDASVTGTLSIRERYDVTGQYTNHIEASDSTYVVKVLKAPLSLPTGM